MKDTFSITGCFHFLNIFFTFHILFSILQVYYQYVYRLVSILQFIFNIFTGCVQYYRLFPVFLQVFFENHSFFLIFLHDYFKYFYRLVVKLQVIFDVFTGCIQNYRFFQFFYGLFEFLQGPVFVLTGFIFTITGCFQFFYRVFSILKITFIFCVGFSQEYRFLFVLLQFFFSFFTV